MQNRSWLLICLLGVLFASGCDSVERTSLDNPDAAQAQIPSETFAPPLTSTTQPSPSSTEAPTTTATAMVTITPTTSSTPTLTPEPLPIFQSRLIRPGNEPHAYLSDPCRYLSLRWSPENSPAGTVVIPIMFHGIRESWKPINDDITISVEQFQDFVTYARYLGFKTITTVQLADFLENNARIPPRSMIMIIDDRRPGTVETHFLPILTENNWTLTLGWIIADTDEKPARPR